MPALVGPVCTATLTPGPDLERRCVGSPSLISCGGTEPKRLLGPTTSGFTVLALPVGLGCCHDSHLAVSLAALPLTQSSFRPGSYLFLSFLSWIPAAGKGVVEPSSAPPL